MAEELIVVLRTVCDCAFSNTSRRQKYEKNLIAFL
jgi:hypothetical protein